MYGFVILGQSLVESITFKIDFLSWLNVNHLNRIAKNQMQHYLCPLCPSFNLLYKMKLSTEHVKLIWSFISLITNLLTEKHSLWGSNPQMVLKNEPMAIIPWKSLRESLYYLYHRVWQHFLMMKETLYLYLIKEHFLHNPHWCQDWWMFPKRFFHMLLYHVRPSTIQFPITMLSMLSCSKWIQWSWWILSQLFLEYFWMKLKP